MRPHIDPTQYAKQRQEQIARAQRLRDERKGRPVPENSGDSLDELAGPIRSEMPHAQPHAQNGSAQLMSSPGLDSLDRATDGTSSSWRAPVSMPQPSSQRAVARVGFGKLASAS